MIQTGVRKARTEVWTIQTAVWKTWTAVQTNGTAVLKACTAVRGNGSSCGEGELGKVRQHCESFKAAALPAAGLAGVPVAPAPAAEEEEQEDLSEFIGKRLMTSKLVARVARGLGEGETFGATRVAAETNRRYAGKLKRPVDARTVSTVLRRLRDAGELHQVRPGTAAHEAVYARGGRG